MALVLFHGYGANERDLAPLGPVLAPTVPWAALRAPLEVAPGGYAWYPIFSPWNPDPARVTDAAWQWIDAHLDPEAKVVGVGFSQGGLAATQFAADPSRAGRGYGCALWLRPRRATAGGRAAGR